MSSSAQSLRFFSIPLADEPFFLSNFAIGSLDNKELSISSLRKNDSEVVEYKKAKPSARTADKSISGLTFVVEVEFVNI